jgi:hypothetical protein
MQDESMQSKGGKARKEALSPEQRADIAKQAAQARWAKRPLEATHKGNFEADFGIDVDCYVLNDPHKTAVLSSRGMGRALGLSDSGGGKMGAFLSTRAMAKFVGPELRAKLDQPIKFQAGSGGQDLPPTIVHGYDVTLLIDTCRAIIDAETSGALRRNHRAVAQAHIILNASARSGIKGLVYALAGYNPAAEEVISAFKLYIQEEARKYEKEFPPELYVQWHRLYQIPVPERGKPWQFRHLTVKHVYYPLAQSNGKILQLVRALKGNDRKKKLFQFLSEVGTRALRFHLGRLLEMAEDSDDQAAYEKKIVKRFGGQQELDLVDIAPPTSSETSA